MAWIQSHQSLGTHKKLVRLAKELGVSRAAAVGLLHYLWWWALDSAADGDLSDVSAEEISDVVQWRDNPEKLLNALISCGWIDSDMSLHEWDTYGATYGKVKEASARRQRLRRKRLRESSVTRDVPVTVTRDVTAARHRDVTVEKEEKEEKYRIPPQSPSGEGEEEGAKTPDSGPSEPTEPPTLVTREMAHRWFLEIRAAGGSYSDADFERVWLRKHSTRDRRTGSWTRGRSLSHDPRADLMLSLNYEADHRQTPGTNGASGNGLWAKKQRLESLRAQMGNHKGNPTGTWSEDTREAYAEAFAALRAEERGLVAEIGGGHEPG